MRRWRFVVVALTLFSHALYADLQENLTSFFDNCGASVNVDPADIYNGQKAGYMTGGGVTMRGRVMDSKLVTVNLPRFDAGCGGIDIFAGGFSFINKQQLIDTLKSIGSSAVGYAFLLGLETVSPQVANTIKQLQTWSNAINNISINSCELASQMVGAVWPQRTAASQQICRTMGSQSGLFPDWVTARHGCAEQSQYQSVSQSIDQDPRYRSILRDEFNIAWEAIQEQSYLVQNQNVAEFFMSLLGTVVVTQGDTTEIQVFPSKIDDEGFLRTLLEGGVVRAYTCGKDVNRRCLVVTDTEHTIRPDESWVGRVRGLLCEVQKKILQDEELSSAERDLLNKTRFPIYRVINALTAYKRGHCPVDLYQVADLVAMDLLVQYLREAVNLVREGAKQLRRGQMYSEEVDRYIEEIGRIERVVHYYETRTNQRIQQEFQLMQKIELIERQISSEILL